MAGWHHQLNGPEFEQALGVGDGQGRLVWYSPGGHKESDTTEQLSNTPVPQSPFRIFPSPRTFPGPFVVFANKTKIRSIRNGRRKRVGTELGKRETLGNRMNSP